MRDPRVSQPFRSPLVTHLGFERGFHRLNEIATHRLPLKLFETYWRISGGKGTMYLVFDRRSEFGIELTF